MKTTHLIMIFTAWIIHGTGLTQDVKWARTFGSPLSDQCFGITMDNYGNTYLAGDFGYIAVDYGGGEYYYETTPYLFIEGDTLKNYGFNNTFLVKYDQCGSLVWAKSIGGLNPKEYTEVIKSLAYDQSNERLVVSGSLSRNVVIDSVTLQCSNWDIFVASFDLDGNCLWGSHFTGPVYNWVQDMDIDETGNIYITGTTSNTMTIGAFTVEKGGFLTKFSPYGVCIWAKRAFSTDTYLRYVAPESIRVRKGGIFIGGYSTSGIFQVDTISIIDTNNILQGGHGFLAEFDTSGNVKWAKLMGTPKAFIEGVDVSYTGEIYGIGVQHQTCSYDSLSLAGGGPFVLRCDSGGRARYVKRPRASWRSHPVKIRIDQNENIYILYYTYGNSGAHDSIIFEKYSHEMKVKWTKVICGTTDIMGYTTFCISPDESSVALSGKVIDDIKIDSSTVFQNTGSEYLTSGDVFFVNFDNYSGMDQGAKCTIRPYPNPTANVCTIQVSGEFAGAGTLSVFLYDLAGTRISLQRAEVRRGVLTIDLSGLLAGCYLIGISNDKKTIVGKIMKM